MVTRDPGETPSLAARLLLLLSFMGLIVAAVLAWTGGFRTAIGGVRLSAHDPVRPALIALALGAAGYWRLGPARHRLMAALLARAGRIAVALLVPAAVAIVLWLGITHGTRAAGGSDPYGYVSQSLLWLKGDVRIHQDFVAAMPWPDADRTFTPLGYRPADHHTLVPSYAPGLPLMMAAFTVMLGGCGPYFVGPICGAALVALTFGLGARVSGRAVGTMAALAVASSPTVLYIALWPMSDVPVATFWVAALLLACAWASDAGAFVCGIAAGVAIAIRPNLVPLAIVPAAIVLYRAAGALPIVRVRRLGAFAAGSLPFVVFIAWLYADLYGSPLRSGYGDSSVLFSWANLLPNLVRYPQWLWETQGPLPFLFLLTVVRWRLQREGAALVALLFAYALIATGCYLWYRPFDTWWFLRFLLPALPVVFILAADVVWTGAGRFGPRVRAAAAAAFTIVIVVQGAMAVRRLEAIEIGRGEQKYADVGRWVNRNLPVNAVVLAMQDSGSIRHYSGRPTLRYDMLDPAWLDRALAHLRQAGYEPYIVLEEFETDVFRERFASQAGATLVDRTPLAEHDRQVRVFGTTAEPNTLTAHIPITRGCDAR